MFRVPMQGMGESGMLQWPPRRATLRVRRGFRAQKHIKTFPFLDTRLWSQSSKTIQQYHNTPYEVDASNQRATQIVFSKVASREGLAPFVM